MSATCPACGVPVVAGYVRCPRCHAALPVAGVARGRHAYGEGGGTAIDRRAFPTSAVVIAALAAAAVIGGFRWRAGERRVDAAPAAPAAMIEAAAPVIAPAASAPAVAPAAAARPAPSAAVGDPAAAIGQLEADLRRQRLWGRAEISAGRVDLRSGLCADPAMKAVVDTRGPLLRSAGLTRLRCLEQSGAVVFERDLGP